MKTQVILRKQYFRGDQTKLSAGSWESLRSRGVGGGGVMTEEEEVKEGGG